MYRALSITLLAIAFLAPPAAKAAFITTHETELESLFAYNGLTLDVRYLPGTVLSDSSFLTLDSAAEFAALLALTPAASSPTINLLFTDSLSWCGVPGAFIGCAELPGYRGVVESVFASTSTGDELVAHEIGHMFGLSHIADVTRLMNPILYGGIVLGATEIATILASPLIQNDGVDSIEILPITVIPEPGTVALLAIGIGGLAARRRRIVARQ